MFRQFVADFNWDSIKSDDVNQYALNFTDKLINLAHDCIPHKQVRIRPRDLLWINGTIRKLMRKRNRLYKKYKRNKTVENYESFKDIRNNVTSSLRKSKKEYFKSLADKLKSASLATSDYWKTLKSFIKPSVNTSIPPICYNGSYISDSSDKAKLLNDFFVSQTSLDDSTATLPNTDLPANNTLHNIIITEEEVRSVYKH